MIEPFSEAQQCWLGTTFAALCTEDEAAQLLNPTLGSYVYRREAVDIFSAGQALGGIFVGIADGDWHCEELAKL